MIEDNSITITGKFAGMYITADTHGFDVNPGTSYIAYLNTGGTPIDYGLYVDAEETPNYMSGLLGIGTTDPKTSLEVNGVMKTTPRASATCDANAEGGIYYDSDVDHFYGCNGVTWVQLDN